MKYIAILGIVGGIGGVLGGMIFESFLLLKIGLVMWGISMGIMAVGTIWNY